MGGALQVSEKGEKGLICGQRAVSTVAARRKATEQCAYYAAFVQKIEVCGYMDTSA